MDGNWISWLVLTPLLGGVSTLLMPRGNAKLLRTVATAFSLVAFVIGWLVWRGFDPSIATMQFVEQRPWIPGIGASYHVGLDGMSLVLVMLTTLLTPLSIIGTSHSIKERLREFLAFLLLLEAAMIGVFVALDLLLFYLFWEAMLIPMAFLIGIWGGKRRVYAAVKFFLYTMAGSVLMLVAILTMVKVGAGALGETTFDLLRIQGLTFTPGIERWLFLAFAIAFAIKVPLFPFHTWLPDAHVEAPTAGSVILAGVLLKMGTYGYLRFCLPLFPGASVEFAPMMAWIAIFGIIYGALMAYAQSDLKKLVAYSSVSHLGWVVLGIFALNTTGYEGGLLQMINHGINTGALFLLVGMVYDRAHSREIEAFGGLARVMPVFALFMMIFTLASIGLPGTNGFVGEFSILVGAFQTRAIYGVLAALGVVLGALYMLSMYRRIFYGAISELSSGLPDIGRRDLVALVPLAILVVWIGLQPQAWMAPAKASLGALDRTMEAKIQFQETMAGEMPAQVWQEEGVTAAAELLPPDEVSPSFEEGRR